MTLSFIIIVSNPQGLKAVKADESKIKVICGKLQISFLDEVWQPSSHLKVKALPIRDWTINHRIIGAICTDHSEALSAAIVKTS